MSRDLQRSVVDAAMRLEPPLRGATVEGYVASGAWATGNSPNLASPAWTRLGVGAVYATSEAYGAGRLWILLLYAR